MMLGFRKQFEPFVSDRSKRHTIRAFRKDGKRWKPGMSCDCYGDSRQKTMHLLGRWKCTRVQQIRIEADHTGLVPNLLIWIDGVQLTADETEGLLYRDGFRSGDATAEAYRHWRKPLKKGPFEGELIHWE